MNKWLGLFRSTLVYTTYVYSVLYYICRYMSEVGNIAEKGKCYIVEENIEHLVYQHTADRNGSVQDMRNMNHKHAYIENLYVPTLYYITFMYLYIKPITVPANIEKTITGVLYCKCEIWLCVFVVFQMICILFYDCSVYAHYQR